MSGILNRELAPDLDTARWLTSTSFSHERQLHLPIRVCA